MAHIELPVEEMSELRAFLNTIDEDCSNERKSNRQRKLRNKEKMGEARIEYTQWLKKGPSTFIPADNNITVDKLEPGVYNLKYNDNTGFYVFKKDLKLDELADLKSKEGNEVLESIRTFWMKKDKFKEYGMVFKRGVLLYGPPGSGKTSIINILVNELITKMNGVVFILQTPQDLRLYRDCIAEIFRVIEPETPIITVIEDIDGLVAHHDMETTLINILDGIDQLENVVYLATTNYTEALSERVLNRPNRFDRRIKIGFPDAKTRATYIKFKLKPHDLENIDLKLWVKETKNMTIAHIGELIKSVIILGNDFKETIKLLKELKEIPTSHEYSKPQAAKSIGFGNAVDDDYYDGEDY